MADNIAVTEGSGKIVRSEEINDKQYQLVKLVDGTEDSEERIPGDETYGLAADVKRIAAGENVIGKVAGGGISISVTPTITAGAYAAKDAVGGEMTFANAVRLSGGSGIINSVVIVDEGDVKAGLELWLFHTTVAEAADNAAMDFTDSELLTCVGVIPISTGDYYSLADNGVGCVPRVGLQFKCAATSLFGQLKCTGTPTFPSTDGLTVTLMIEYLD